MLGHSFGTLFYHLYYKNELQLYINNNNAFLQFYHSFLGNYILQYLSTRISLTPYVVRALVQLIARISKHGWFDNDKSKGFMFRDILDEVGKFLQVNNSRHAQT